MDLYSEVVDVPIEEDQVDNQEAKIEENGLGMSGSSETMTIEDRLKKRAKRPSKYLMKHLKESGNGSPTSVQNGPELLMTSALNGVRTAKNSRRPRNGYGRGLPKKGTVSLYRYLSIS